MLDSVASCVAAAARNGLTAANWSGGDPRWSLGSAAATAKAPRNLNLVGLVARGAVLTKSKVVITSESQRPLGGALGRTLAGPIDSEAHMQFGVPIQNQETLAGYIDNANNAEIDHLVALFSDGKGQKPLSSYLRTFPIRASSTQTLTQYAWTAGSLTIDGALLPNRIYHLLAASAASANLCALRFISAVPGDNSRPTVVGAPSAVTAALQKFPEVMEFVGNLPPTYEALAGGADTAEEVVMLLGDTGRDIGPALQQRQQQ